MSETVVWRICARSFADDAFAGRGSARRPGRWNPPGACVVYCAESRSLAAMEILANVRATKLLREHEWVVIAAVLPQDTIERPARIPENWQANPQPHETQAFGARWVESARSVALRVPSVVVHGEFNYLLNPAHPDFARVRLLKPEPFRFDPRLC